MQVFKKLIYQDMYRLFLFLLIFNLLCSCEDEIEKEYLNEWIISYPPELKDDILLFKRYAPPHIKSKKLTIIFKSELGDNHVGLSNRKNCKIYIDSSSFAYKVASKTILFHELGHYVLNRNHDNRIVDISYDYLGLPKSFMYPTIRITNWHLKNNFLMDYYMRELFGYIE